MFLSYKERIHLETAPIILFVFDEIYSVVQQCQIGKGGCFCAQQSISIKVQY